MPLFSCHQGWLTSTHTSRATSSTVLTSQGRRPTLPSAAAPGGGGDQLSYHTLGAVSPVTLPSGTALQYCPCKVQGPLS